MIDDEYPGGLHPIPTKLPEDPRDDQPFRSRRSTVDPCELAAIRAEVRRLQHEADAVLQELVKPVNAEAATMRPWPAVSVAPGPPWEPRVYMCRDARVAGQLGF